MRFRTSHAGGSETRPAGHDAGLPGAGCPGRGSVVRDHEARDRTEPRLEGLWREPRRSAERRGRPQADDRGNADHSWRSPHWLADSDALIRSAGAEVDYAPLGAPPPLIIWRQKLSCRGFPKARAQKRVARTVKLIPVHLILRCERSDPRRM